MLGLGALGLVIAVLGTAWVTAEVRVRRRAHGRPRPSTTARLATTMGLPPPLLIGSRLAVESGQGRRAVPVRSALVGAVVGVLGVVACLTFRAGLSDTVADPGRSGVVWDFAVAAEGAVAKHDVAAIAHDDAINAALDAQWSRAGTRQRPADTDVRNEGGQGQPELGRPRRARARAGCMRSRLRRRRCRRWVSIWATGSPSGPARARHARRRQGVAPGELAHRLRRERMDDPPRVLRRADPTGAGPDSIEDYVLVRFQSGSGRRGCAQAPRPGSAARRGTSCSPPSFRAPSSVSGASGHCRSPLRSSSPCWPWPRSRTRW